MISSFISSATKKKHNSLFTFFLFLSHLSLYAVPDISMDVARFKSESGTYIEIALYVVGETLKCDAASPNQKGLNCTLFIENQQGEIVTGDKFRLLTNDCPSKDLIDVRRFGLAPGSYTIRMETIDLFDTTQAVTIEQEIAISGSESFGYLSDLQLMASVKNATGDGSAALEKSGLYLEPLPFHYYYPSIEKLSLYYEIYDADQVAGQPYAEYTIRPIQGDIPAPLTTFRKINKEKISSQIFQLDIREMITAPYSMRVRLFDGNKMAVDSAFVYFSRFNPEGDSIYIEKSPMDPNSSFANAIPADSLDYIMRAMAPVVNSLDNEVMNTLLKKDSEKMKRFFIHRYWSQQAGRFASVAYGQYMKVARVVDQNYASGFGYGFESDRGHIFLKYGKPDEVITVEDEPSAPPYEIWFYTTFPATHQQNVRFLFYNPSLVKNGHILLHSTAIGERKNDRWEIELYRDAALERPGVNDKAMGDNVHRNARRYFDQ